MYIAEYPQDRYRFRLYDNQKRLTWQQVQKETGCYALVNLQFFEFADFEYSSATMVAGEWQKAPQWHEYGVCIDADGVMTIQTETEAAYDYAIGGPPLLIGGRRYARSGLGVDGHTMVGRKADGTVVVAVATKDRPQAVETMETALRERGCEDILLYDGSWSSQGDLGGDLVAQPSLRRIVRSYLLVFRREDKEDQTEESEGQDMSDPSIAGVERQYMTKNRCYTNFLKGITIQPKGIMVHSTATPGATARGLRGQWDDAGKSVSVHALIDDTVTLQALPWTARAWHCAGAGNDTHISFEICEPMECRLLPIEWVTLKKGSSGWAVERLQRELTARGYDPKGVDGVFGPGCEAAVKQYQCDSGLSVDGMVGPATKAALAARMGSCLQYDPQETEAFFRAVWDRAVCLCAELCKVYGLDPVEDILCHAEGHRAGIANNHADVEHWWPLSGRSMDDFRAAVNTAMRESGNKAKCPACGHEFYTS